MYRDVDVAGYVGLREVEVLDEGGEEFSGMEFWCGGGVLPRHARVRDPGPQELREFFPEKFATVEDFSSPHVEQVHGQHVVFVVIAEDIGIVTVDSGDAVVLLQL